MLCEHVINVAPTSMLKRFRGVRLQNHPRLLRDTDGVIEFHLRHQSCRHDTARSMSQMACASKLAELCRRLSVQHSADYLEEKIL